MSHESYGYFTCKECGELNINPQIMDMDEDSSLIYCTECQKWVRWC